MARNKCVQVAASFPSFAQESMWSGLRAAALSPQLAEAYTASARQAAEEASKSVSHYIRTTDRRIAEQQRELGRQCKHSAAEVAHELYSCQLCGARHCVHGDLHSISTSCLHSWSLSCSL